jgi:hypothetical protein
VTVAGAGTLWVTVKPSLEGFGADLRRQIEQSIPPEIRVRVRPDDDAATQGTQYAGKFADALKARLAAALRDMPKVELDADATPAQRRVQELRAQLEALGDKKIGVDIDAADAKLELDRLKAELDQLARSSPDVRIRVDAAAAVAELERFRAEVDELDGKTARVDVDTSSGVRGMSALMTAGLALGPALIPIGAGIAAALLSIGPAAIAGAGAIGVIGLAFSGVDKAISAYSSQQDKAATSATKSASTQQAAALSIASAQDSVKNAVTGVATAQENASASIKSALNSQVSAEEALSNAQRAQKTAQDNLTQARKDAVTALRDLTFSVADNALSQRSAQFALDDALATQRSDAAPGGSLQAGKDQLAVDQARQQITELQAQGKDLADQKKSADQQGIEGSNQVVSAQQAVTAAVQQTGDAERALQAAGDAVSKAQVDGARSVAQAQQGVIAAQRGLEQAQLSAATSAAAAGGATDAYATAMGKLSPAGRAFVEFYTSTLKPQFDDMAKVAQAGLLPGLQSGIVAATPALNQLKTFIGNISKELGHLADEAGHALSSPFWHDFFDFMNTTAGPSIDKVATAIGNFLKGAAGIMEALYQPVFVPIMTWIGDLAKRFADFGADAAAGTSTSFNGFLQYVKDNGPKIRDLIEELAKLVGNIVSAMSGQGAGTLSVLVDVLKWINSLPPPVIKDLIDLFIAMKLFKLGAGVVEGIGSIWGSLKNIRDAGGLKGVLGSLALGVVPLVLAYTFIEQDQGRFKDDPTGKNPGTVPADPTSVSDYVQQGNAGLSSLGGGLGQLLSGHGTEGPGGLEQWSNDQRDLFNKQLGDIGNSPAGRLLKQITGAPTGPASATDSKGNQPGGRASVGSGDNLLPGTKPADTTNWWDASVAAPTRGFFEGISKNIGKWWTDDVWTPTKNFFTGLPKTISKLWNDNVWNPTRDFFTGLFKTINKWWTDNVWNPTRDFFTGLPKTISKWWNDNVWNPTRDFFTGLPKTINKWWTDNVWNPTRDFFAGLPKTISKWWNDNVWNPTRDFFTGLPKTISKWWTDNVWNPTRDFFADLPKTITKWWTDNVWNPTRDFFADLPKTITKWWTDNVWNPTRDFFTGLPGTISKWWNDNVWNPTRDFFTGLPKTITKWWNENVWNPTRDFFTGLPDTVRKWWNDNVWNPTSDFFTGLGKDIAKWWHDRIESPLIDAVNTAGDRIGVAWRKIANFFRDPINWVIRTVIDDGILTGWNTVMGWIGQPGLAAKPLGDLPVYADGGPVHGPGTGTSDSIIARVSNGEYIVPAATTARHLNFLEALRQGQPEAVQAAGGATNPSYPAFAAGGLVNAAQVAQAMNGKPYVWGGAGPNGADCSGYQSIITNALRGVPNPYSRVGTTDTFPWSGFAPGLGGAYAVGAFKGNPGHMAGTLAGVNVESGGPHNNVAYGGPAAGADAGEFNVRAFLPQIGGEFASGGPGGGGGSQSVSWWSLLSGKVKDLFAGALNFGGMPARDSAVGDAIKRIPTGLVSSTVSALENKLSNLFTTIFTQTVPGTASPTGMALQGVVDAAAKPYGWGLGSPDWTPLSLLIGRESGWNPTAQNPHSTAYGMFQFLDAVWPTVGGSKTSDPALQAQYGMRYIKNRYGNPKAAWGHETSMGWYDTGGALKPGWTSVFNGTGRNEHVLDPDQTVDFHDLVATLKTNRVLAAGGSALNQATRTLAGGAAATPAGDTHLHLHDTGFDQDRAFAEFQRRQAFAGRLR